MRSKSRTIFFEVNARASRQSVSAQAFYPQIASVKQTTRVVSKSCSTGDASVRPGNSRDGRVKSIVPGSADVTYADEISMTEDSDGILGNLPRSRPGVRSEKRASAKRTAPAKPKPAAKQRTKPRPAAPAAPPPPPPPPPPSRSDPVGLAVKTAGQVAETGLKVAARVAGGVLRRLPRP
jgi:hypothetical protein